MTLIYKTKQNKKEDEKEGRKKRVLKLGKEGVSSVKLSAPSQARANRRKKNRFLPYDRKQQSWLCLDPPPPPPYAENRRNLREIYKK